MRDRVSLYPGRVKLTPVVGETDTFDMVRADAPTDVGTELSKKNLLQDSTEISLFGSAADRTVDEAFAGIAVQLKLIMSDSAAITLAVQDAGGNPLPGVLVQGVLSENGQAVYTNDSGVATGFAGEGKTTITVSGYADIADYTETLDVVKGTTIAKTLKLTTRNFLGVNASGYVKFSGNVNTIDYSVTSGGGGGSGGYGFPGGGGGAGGGTITKTGIAVEPNKQYAAVIGAGGASGYGDAAGKSGGKSSFLGDSPNGGAPGTPAANGTTGGAGGSGGAGTQGGGSGGNGGSNYANGSNGSNATSTAFTSFTGTKALGGGGAGGEGKNYSGASATDGIVGGAANTGGGGSGGYGAGKDKDGDYNNSSGSYGYSGFIGIRMHLKSAA
jgi:hypothetical protein